MVASRLFSGKDFRRYFVLSAVVIGCLAIGDGALAYRGGWIKTWWLLGLRLERSESLRRGYCTRRRMRVPCLARRSAS